MGTNIGGLIEPKIIRLDDLKGKTVSIDAFNMLYQFITTIRQADGSYLTDSKGRITSHLSGLFSRSINLLQKGVRPVMVFDGKPPELKMKERERRSQLKDDAQQKYDEAVQKEDIESMRKFAGRTAKLTSQMVDESKELLSHLGIPVIQAPSEGEAQVAHMVREGLCAYGASQDYDSLLHGNPKIIRNLTLSGKRKKALGYRTITPELIELSNVLNTLGIDQSQLITLAVMVGTDYNIGGIRGIGPKKALAIVKKNGKDTDSAMRQAGWSDDMPDYNEIISTIKNMPVTSDAAIEWGRPDKDKVKALLCDKHDFSVERIDSAFEKIEATTSARSQTGLREFF